MESRGGRNHPKKTWNPHRIWAKWAGKLLLRARTLLPSQWVTGAKSLWITSRGTPQRQTKINRRNSSSSSPSSSHSPRSQVIRPRYLRSPNRISTSSTKHLTKLARTSLFLVGWRVPSQRNVNIKDNSHKRGQMTSLKPLLHRTFRDPRTRQMLEVDLKMLDK